MYLPFQVKGFGALAAASFMHFHQVISWTAAACEAFLRIFALVIHGFSSWLGTLGGHDAFAPVFIMLLSVIVGGSIAMRAMALVVCFSTGSSVQEPVASSLAVCWNEKLHVLGLRIVVLGCGGCQARGRLVMRKTSRWKHQSFEVLFQSRSTWKGSSRIERTSAESPP